MTNELTPKIGHDCGYWLDQAGNRHYYETTPSRIVEATVQVFITHQAIIKRHGQAYYHSFITGLVCNPLRSSDWRRRL